MQTGAITEHFDVAFVAINAFFLFFFGLVYYLRREDRREGYPLVDEATGKPQTTWFPGLPEKKSYLLADGSTLWLPRDKAERSSAVSQLSGPPGAPFVPTGNPLRDAVGPASYAERQDHTDNDWEGHPRIVPLRVATGYFLEPSDPDPRGYDVVAADGKVAGTLAEVWIDRAEPQVYYYEAKAGGRTVLIPARLAVINETARSVIVELITAAQFADVPALKNPDQITLLEEDKIAGYFAGGKLYATKERQDPLI